LTPFRSACRAASSNISCFAAIMMCPFDERFVI
jgi:hypothetical protein